MNFAGTTASYYINNNDANAIELETNGNSHAEAVADLIEFWNSTVDDKVVEAFEVYSEDDNDDETITVIKGDIAARDEDGDFTDETDEITVIVATDKG